MTHLMRARDVIGLPVVSIASGEAIAEVRDVVYDASKHELVGFTLNKRGPFSGRMKAVLGANFIAAIGADAVMINEESALSETGDEAGALHDPDVTMHVIGTRVLSADGSRLGQVADVILATGERPAAVGYEISQGQGSNAFVPISAQVALSGDNLLLPSEATDFIRNDLAGFGAAVDSYRGSTLQGEDR